MSKKRMFSPQITDSDAFLDMPLSTQCLYFHICMHSDDEGFCNQPKKIMRMLGASEDDLKLLLVKKFMLSFENGVVVIKHWYIHNYIAKDRFTETVYREEKNQLTLDEQKVYHKSKECKVYTECIQDVSQMCTQYSIDKIREDKSRLEESVDIEQSSHPTPSRMQKPTLEEVTAYFLEIGGSEAEASHYFDYYTSNGWKVSGKASMKDWKSACRNWHRNESKFSSSKTSIKKQDALTEAMNDIYGGFYE